MPEVPQTQYAVQLVGPDELVFNDSKAVNKPGPYQILCRVEAVGLCFSDLKLLKQFSAHVRKSEIIGGIAPEILKEVPSYVPNEKPTVPGHEAVIRIELAGSKVEKYKPNQRYLVQADWRWIRTATSNGAFGYNFEGALQEYVLLDTRLIASPEGESMLIPVSEQLSASAAALVEPWGCVEDAYASKERQRLKENGRMLIVADREIQPNLLKELFSRFGRPGQIIWISEMPPPAELGKDVNCVDDIAQLEDASFDDVIYFGSQADKAELIFDKVGKNGLINFVLCGGKFGKPLALKIGWVHYGGIRIVGTCGENPAEAMEYIPATDEIRPGDKIEIVGAGGPMGTMHVIRDVCQGIRNVSICATDLDDRRLEELSKIAKPLADRNNVRYESCNPKTDCPSTGFDYTAIMAPVPQLVSAAINSSNHRGLINIFAGIPATVTAELDLDAYIDKQLYFIGTSGSTLDDMKLVLEKVESGRLDTNTSVAAICGLKAATKGIRAVENRSVPGKVIVYPACKGLDLICLDELPEKMPDVARYLENGVWTKQAEAALLKKFNS